MFAPADLPAALAHPLPPAQVAAGAAASLLWAAEHAETLAPIGFVLCERPTHKCLHIREMDVRQGSGAKVLSHGCTAAWKASLQFSTLTTFSHVPWNAPFYAKSGFCVTADFASFPYLAAILKHETELGLRNRVAMVRGAA
jgi:hypothetical protein